MADLTPLENLRVWVQALKDSERTVICSPELESRVKTMVAQSGASGLFDVQVVPGTPDAEVFVLDHNAAEALTRQELLRLRRHPPDLFADRFLGGYAALRRDWTFGHFPSTLPKGDVS